MELVVVLGLLLGLAITAPRWGYDSRIRLHSKEEALAAAGLRWPRRTVADGPAPRPTVARRATPSPTDRCEQTA